MEDEREHVCLFERESSATGLQMATTARVESSQNQEPRAPSGSSKWVVGTQILELSSAPGLYQGIGSEVNHPEHEFAPIWDTSITSYGITLYATMSSQLSGFVQAIPPVSDTPNTSPLGKSLRILQDLNSCVISIENPSVKLPCFQG